MCMFNASLLLSEYTIIELHFKVFKWFYGSFPLSCRSIFKLHLNVIQLVAHSIFTVVDATNVWVFAVFRGYKVFVVEDSVVDKTLKDVNRDVAYKAARCIFDWVAVVIACKGPCQVFRTANGRQTYNFSVHDVS